MFDKCSFGFHKWGQWKTYKWRGAICPPFGKSFYPITELRQTRTCSVCGKEQDELVRDG